MFEKQCDYNKRNRQSASNIYYIYKFKTDLVTKFPLYPNRTVNT